MPRYIACGIGALCVLVGVVLIFSLRGRDRSFTKTETTPEVKPQVAGTAPPSTSVPPTPGRRPELPDTGIAAKSEGSAGAGPTALTTPPVPGVRNAKPELESAPLTGQPKPDVPTVKAEEVVEHYTAFPSGVYDSKSQKVTTFFDLSMAGRAAPSLELSRDREFTLALVPKQQFVKFYVEQARGSGQQIGFLESLALSNQVSGLLDKHDLQPTEMTFHGSKGITGSISTQAKKSTFASRFLIQIVLSANCKLGPQDLTVFVPSKGKVADIDTLVVTIPVEVR